jgi:hypothetical protein
MTEGHQSKLFTLPFILVSLSSLVCFTSFQFLVPTLPIYLTKVIGGAQAEIGLVMGSHTLTSMTSAVAPSSFWGSVASFLSTCSTSSPRPCPR